MKATKEQTSEIDKVAAALVTLIQSPDTPTDLYNDVSNWITSATNIEDSNGDSLIHRWTYDPDTIRACVSWSLEEQHRKEYEATIMQKSRRSESNA